jgi:hypothetical protein
LWPELRAGAGEGLQNSISEGFSRCRLTLISTHEQGYTATLRFEPERPVLEGCLSNLFETLGVSYRKESIVLSASRDRHTVTAAGFALLLFIGLPVLRAQPLTLLPASAALPTAVEGANYPDSETNPNVRFSATGTTGEGAFFDFSGCQNLPLGMNAPGEVTYISGAPSVGTAGKGPNADGSYPCTVKVTDSGTGATVSRTYSLTVIGNSLSLSPASIPPAAEGALYKPLTLTGLGGVPPTKVFQSFSNLPFGMSIDSNNTLSGTPGQGTACQTCYSLFVVVQDSVGNNAFVSKTLAVNPPFRFGIPEVLPVATELQQYPVVLFSASGGGGGFSFALNPLPLGLSVVSSALGGIPASGTAGFYSPTLTVTDQYGNSVSPITYNLSVRPAPLTLTPPSLPVGVAGLGYGPVTLTPSGGIPPYSFGLSGTLPPGIQFVNGVFSGVPSPTSFGSYPLVIRVSDRGETSIQVRYTLLITPGRLTLTTPTLPPGGLNQPYSQQIGVSGGVPPYIFALSSGQLPLGLTLSSRGLVSGNPQQIGTFTFGITITDSQQLGSSARAVRTESTSGLFASAGFAVTLTIQSPLSITTTTLPPVTPYVPYSASIGAAGGTPPYQWTTLSGNLPPGLSINPFTGAITGAFTGDSASTFVIQITDAAGASVSRAFTLGGPNPPPVIVTPSPLPPATVGSAYSLQLSATGVLANSHWTLDSGALPPEFSLSDGGLITGTPSATGSYSFSIRFTDVARRSDVKSYALTVNSPLLISTTSPLPDSVNGTVSSTFSATGGVPPYTWSVSTGALPSGISLASNGALSGTSTVEGTFSFQITVTDSAGNKTARSFTIHVTPPLGISTTSPLPDASTEKAYSVTLVARGGVAPYAWSSDTLPGGLTLASATGIISGTPTVPGKFTLNIKVADQKGFSASGPFTLQVTPPVLVILSDAQLPGATAKSPYSFTFAGQGGVKPYSWSVSTGIALTGLGLTPDGVLTGTPSAPGTFNFNVVMTDAQANSVRKDFTLVVGPETLSIPGSTLPGGVTGSTYTQTVTANGGIPPYRWSGNLPPGLSIDPATGIISGSTTATGNVTIIVIVTDNAGTSSTQSYTVNFALPPLPPIAPSGLPSTIDPLKQPTLQLGLSGTYPVDITGVATLQFAADRGGDDPAVQFSSGGRTVTFIIPAGSNLATFEAPSLALQTGTVAGLITINVTFQASGTNITPTPVPSQQVRIPSSAPVITALRATRSGTQIQVFVTGYSTTREMTQAVFRFNPASGANLQTGDVTVPVSAIFTTWYSSADATPFGGQFTFTQPFNIQGDPAAVTSVTVTMTNSVGNSTPVSANIQ